MYNPLAPTPFFTRDNLAFGNTSTFGLLVDVISSDTDTLHIRGFTQSGAFTLKCNHAGDGEVQSFSFVLPDIPVSLTASFDQVDFAEPLANVNIHLTVNGDRIALLCQGLVGTIFGLSWPYSQQLTSMQQGGAIVHTRIVSPGAGEEVSFSTPTNELWELYGLVLKLTTSATVADRTVTLEIVTNRSLMIRKAAGTTQQASETQRYSFIHGGVTGVQIADQRQEIALPEVIYLPAQSSIETTTTNIQVGDQFDLIFPLIRRHYIVEDQS